MICLPVTLKLAYSISYSISYSIYCSYFVNNLRDITSLKNTKTKIRKSSDGVTGIRTQDLLHAKQTRYPYAITPVHMNKFLLKT